MDCAKARCSGTTAIIHLSPSHDHLSSFSIQRAGQCLDCTATTSSHDLKLLPSSHFESPAAPHGGVYVPIDRLFGLCLFYYNSPWLRYSPSRFPCAKRDVPLSNRDLVTSMLLVHRIPSGTTTLWIVLCLHRDALRTQQTSYFFLG